MLAIAHPVVATPHHSQIASSSSTAFRRVSRPSPSASSTTRPHVHLNTKPATPPPPIEQPNALPLPTALPSPPPPVNIHSYPTGDLLRLLASLLTQIAATNDALSPTSPVTPSHSSRHLHSETHMALWPTLTTASRGALVTASSTLTFHARNIPTISLEAYLLRILKYCPTTNEVFLSLLVYFDRMSKLSNDSVGRGFVIDSYNIHRLVIAGVTVASKFFSDVFYTNSRYAKVGGLPLAELNQLELQFLLLNDFRLVISTAEMQRYAEQLILFSTATASPETTSTPVSPAPSHPPPSPSSSHLTNGTSSAPPAPSPSPSAPPPPSSNMNSKLTSHREGVSSSQAGHPQSSRSTAPQIQQRPHPSSASNPYTGSQPSHAALAQMGAIDAYGGALPGSPRALHARGGVNASSSTQTISYTHPLSRSHPPLPPHPRTNHADRRSSFASTSSSSVSEDDGQDSQTDTETETETEAETEEGEGTTTSTDDEPTIRPGSIYGYGGDGASVYSVESAGSSLHSSGSGGGDQGSIFEGGIRSGGGTGSRGRSDSRASMGSMWDTGDEGGDESPSAEEEDEEEEEQDEDTEDEDDNGVNGRWRTAAGRSQPQGKKPTRKRTRSFGSDEVAGHATPGKMRGGGGDCVMASP